MKNILLQIFLLIIIIPRVYAQENEENSTYPEVGRRCPEFIFDDVEYYSKKLVTLKDFKGKWLVLDCWNRHCGACIQSMRHIDSLQQLFGDKVQFLLVGYTGSLYTKHSDDSIIRGLFAKLRIDQNLNIPIAYDSVLFQRFDIGGCPFIVIVDPDGIIRGFTYKLTAKNVNELMAGRKPDLLRAFTLGEVQESNYIKRVMNNHAGNGF